MLPVYLKFKPHNTTKQSKGIGMSINNVHREDFCFTSLSMGVLRYKTMKRTFLTIHSLVKASVCVFIFFQICLCVNVFSRTLLVSFYTVHSSVCSCSGLFHSLFPCIWSMCVFKPMLTCMNLLVLVFTFLYLSLFASTCLYLPVSAYSCPYLPVSSCISWCD